MAAKIESVYRGQPKVLRDERGEWVSSIDRERVDVPFEVLSGGLLDDQVAQSYHGGADAAICVHLWITIDFGKSDTDWI
jgi:MOSC domain-containing protein YiiM